ncbi:hypothetical protein A3C26_00685 [Candidatus Daviesbacteria bacterium RIFCSPHIGHO2_02_FULL_39_12]|uniref:Uncharacterized protein n=2 Tax=Candidatus Daviesiibacteriota TaxID=1752718 RepID=A0A1F5J9Y1_9BACT|nr:MAG: hypothetical protein A3C26_00685 [Candidatus Daviesbacteria bacterium RIFCSPHIGHO2_02_FULL_39_12]OGE72523.1 MAG: hypothetical protein A3H40_00270 [Candidatus Daviesbacteria bacterium RIFCSPLOWO2_02_FULL_38_15]
MAQEHMAEGGSSPDISPVLPQTSIGQEAGPKQPSGQSSIIADKPWYISPEYDPKRQDYLIEEKGKQKVWTDPITREKVAWVTEVAGGDGFDEQKKAPGWWSKVKGFDQTEWEKLEPEDRTVQAAVLVMRHFYNMPNVERVAEANKNNFNAAYKAFAEYALSKKLYDGKDTRIIAVELELVNYDEEEIDKYKGDPAKQGRVIDTLNRWDALKQEQISITAGRESFGIKDGIPETEEDHLCPPHASREEWKRYLKRPTQIVDELKKVKQELTDLTSSDFVSNREKRKEEVRGRVNKLKEEIASKEDAEPWKKEARDLEENPLKDTEARLTPENQFNRASVQLILQRITEENNKPAAAQDATVLEQANRALEWNFHQARNLGIFEDLEGRLDRRYQELALSLFSQSRADQVDADMEGRRGSRNLTFAEVKEIIAKESDEDSKDSFINTAELGAVWKQLIRDGVVSKEDENHFKGIRKAFVSGAYDQIYDSLSNLYYKRLLTENSREALDQQKAQGTITQKRYDRLVGEIKIQRISGEWDIRGQERAARERLDADQKAEEDKLFYVDRYYLTLIGTTEAQVEQGVNNYLTGLLEGAHVYDVQTIMQKMQYLSAAIMSKKDVLIQSGMSASAAQKALTRINILAENRGEFYVMNFAAANLLMDEYFIPLYEKWGGVIGIDKMIRILDMNNGLVAPAMMLFLDPKNRLLFQPAGFEGQGTKNIWAQRTLRNKIKEQLAEELVNYQAKAATPTELMEQTTWQDFLRMKFEPRHSKPKEKASVAKDEYKVEFERVKKANDEKKVTDKDLESLRKAKEQYTKLQNQYDRLLVQAKSAIETTWQVFNIFGESARLGAPSIIMENGEHISIEDVTYVYKFAILDAMKKNNDSPARMRWRAYQWATHPWVYDKGKPVIKYKDEKGKEKIITGLVKGLEDTGITQEAFTAFLKAAKSLRDNGYKAVFESSTEKNADGTPRTYTFEDIVNKNELNPVRDNFISNYKASREIFANLTAMREAKKGRQPFIKKILERLDQSGRGDFTTLDKAEIDGKSLEELPDEKLKELFEDAITDSLIFHITVRQLARWEATFKPDAIDSADNMRCDSRSNIEGKFSTDRIYYGSQDIPWGVKRLQYLPEYWMTNKRERIGRAWELLPFVPLLKSSLAEECDAENLPDLILNVNKEHIDEPGLKQIAAGFKDAQGWRQRGETSIDEQRGETSWSFWDKLTVDSAQILKYLPKLPQSGETGGATLDMLDYIEAPDPSDYMNKHPLFPSTRKDLVDVTREILKREAPLNIFLEAQLGYNRSAGGSGIGLEMGERWHYRILNWWLSSKRGIRQEEGGLEVNKDAETFLRFITIKNSWSSDGVSILDEAWRQARGTRDAGVSKQLPQKVIKLVAK